MKNNQDINQKIEDHILRRYEILEFKGKGAYGVVWKVKDKRNQKIFALKKVFDAFQNATDAQRTFREVIFLEQMSTHENIIRLQNVIRAENNKDLYMVFDFMETDLHKVIRANILEAIHKKYIIYQILKALKYMHSAGLIHRDLKPANVLLNGDCKAKLADFGLVRSISQANDEIMLTEYVATRWYRAPEILLGSRKYTKAVDIWSLGLILAEMLLGKPLFAVQKGQSTLNQVEKIMELIGKPTTQDLEDVQQSVVQGLPTVKQNNLKQVLVSADADSLDFIQKCLVYNPSQRMTLEECFKHKYLKEFVGSEKEEVYEKTINTMLNDNFQYTVNEYRDYLFKHINDKKKLEHIIIRNFNQKLVISNNFPSSNSGKASEQTKDNSILQQCDKIEEKKQKFRSPQQKKVSEKSSIKGADKRLRATLSGDVKFLIRSSSNKNLKSPQNSIQNSISKNIAHTKSQSYFEQKQLNGVQSRKGTIYGNFIYKKQN